jgi:hypothetical protein
MAKPAIEPPKVHIINRLYWNKFPFSIELNFSTMLIRADKKSTAGWNSSYWGDGYRASQGTLGNGIKALVPADKKIAKLVRTYNVWKVFFVDESDFDKFLVDVKAFEKNVAVTGVWKPESTDHLELLQQDHKLVTRTSLFHQKYTWKITFKSGYLLESKDELVEWINEIYKTDDVVVKTKYWSTWSSDRYRFADGNHIPILYLNDEDDVIMAKLIYTSSIKKIEKAVILENKNNNKGNTEDESGTVSQIG